MMASSNERFVKRASRAIVLCVALAGCADRREPYRLPAITVESPVRLDAVVIQGATRSWTQHRFIPARFGDPVPVRITEYCLSGTTRRGRYVRPGIVAADPRFFPLSRYIELYVGGTYVGRYLVDDTGKRIKGARIDVWTASCREARRFGIQPGTAVLVARPPAVRLAGKPK